MEIWLYLAMLLLGYFLGNVQSAYFLSKEVMHQDIRTVGSGSAGATNMLRSFGIKMAIFTFAGDLVKTVVAVAIARWIGGETAGYFAGIGSIIGHNWPFVLGFHGGKGIACTAGLILMVNPLMAGGLIVGSLLLAIIVGFMSVGSLAGVTGFVVCALIIYPGNTPLLIAALAAWALAVFGHRENIKRLINGTENKLSVGKHKRPTRNLK